MALRIHNNVEAFNAHRNLSNTGTHLAKSLEKLSSGYRINRAADDAAGLAISEKLRGQIKGLAQAGRNVGDAISLVQTAEGSMNEVHSMLQRVRELAVQFGNGTLSNADKASITAEVAQLQSDIERIGANTEFNGIKLLTGTGGAGGSANITFQVGAKDSQTIVVATASLGSLVTTAAFSLNGNATDIAEIDTAIDALSKQRGVFGAVQNRLEYTANDLSTYQENLTAAESRIRDVDMAAEMAQLTKFQILNQAGTSMLAQANQAPQGVLSLLG
jgi:flagellin